MPLSDWINLGSELLELGTDMRRRLELSKRFPEAIEAYTELGIVCEASKLNFQNSTTFLGYSSTYWSKGRLFDGCALTCQALVDPLNRTIEVIYVPEEGVFVQRDSRVLWLLNWANEQVSVGRFHIYSKASTLHRPDLMRLAYHCTMSYDKLDKGELRRLIGNVLGNVKSTCTRFAPVIQALRDQSIDISRTGKLEDRRVRRSKRSSDRQPVS